MSTLNKPPFKRADPAAEGHQYLEDLACAYWHSEVLFGALELSLFTHIEESDGSLPGIAAAGNLNEGPLERLLTAMERMALVGNCEGSWYLQQVSRRFLLPSSGEYMGDFLLYRRYMQENWQALARKVSAEEAFVPPGPSPDADYAVRNFNYVRTLDALARRKAAEILAVLSTERLEGPLLDVGGGAGALGRALLKGDAGISGGVLYDLPEVIDAARKIYPDPADWEGFDTLGGDFRTHRFDGEARFGLIVMGNFLHAYGPDTAETLLKKAASLLLPGGKILIHDYFPDRRGSVPDKGPLYDLAMMLNTYDGACHDAAEVRRWLTSAGFSEVGVRDLGTDSSLILAGEGITDAFSGGWRGLWEGHAASLGFLRAVAMDPERVVTGAWVRKKCRYGCGEYGKGLQCPPHTMDHGETRELLDGYSRAILVEGTPPGKAFHRQLLELEKAAFLQGYHKALVFGAGPCTICESCPEEGPCRHTDRARPAMEASGIDVYETAKNAGLDLAPVKERQGYVKYLGLLLLE